jgi:hypothetical protein
MRIPRFPRTLALALASSFAVASLGLGSAPLIAIAGLAGPVLLGARSTRAETPVIYKWVDEHGIAHYTTDRDRIPSSLRDRVEQIGGSNPTRSGSDWLDLDAGQKPPPAATSTQEGVAVHAPGDFQSGTPAAGAPPGAGPAAAAKASAAAPAPAPAGGGSAPGAQAPAAAAASAPASHETVDGYRAKPDYSAAPGGEAHYAPGDLGEPGKGGPASASAGPTAPRAAAPAPAQTPAVSSAPEAGAAPSLAADGAPVERPPASAAAPAPSLTSAPEPGAEAGAGSPETAQPEPSEPAAVASRAPLTPSAATELHDIDQRIADLESRISKDEETLATLISTPDAERKGPLVDDAQFREIAQRLPKQQAELEKLREQRGRIQPAASAP